MFEEIANGNSTSIFVERVHADVSGVHLEPAGGCGASEGSTQEVSAGVAAVVATFDPELGAEGRVEDFAAAGIDVTAAVVDTDAAAGMLDVTPVATVTPAETAVEAAAGCC